jgi:F-type H+-transporting ATPase subunit epsilon
MATNFKADLVTPEALVLETEVSEVQLPGHDGYVGILNQRAPLLTKLGVGILQLHTPTGVRKFLVSGGYAQMKDNLLTILTDEAIPEAQITPELVKTKQSKLAEILAQSEAQTWERKWTKAS